MMTLIRAMVVSVGLTLCSVVALAQSSPDHLVALNTRTFDLGIDVSKMRRDPDFVPMNEVGWLSPILDADPALGPTVFHIKLADPRNVSINYLWEYVRNNARHFTYSEHIPERFQIPGYQAWSANEDGLGRVLLIPTDSDAEYSVTCDQSRKTGEVVYCHILASYPPDPLIYLQARHYSPQNWNETREELDDIVARMREIAACLDVTDRELELDQSGLPKHTTCKTGAGM
jgi:hypothetical protein